MNILLIAIHHYQIYYTLDGKTLSKNGFLPVSSYTLMQLAALTPEKYNVIALDNPKNIDFNGDYDLIAISMVTPLANYAYEIADKFRNSGKTVIFGGYHTSALPNEAKMHADSVVVGEADEIWPSLLHDFEREQLKPYYYQKKPVSLSNLPIPNRNIFNENDKRLPAPIQVSRGCPIGCEFCAISSMICRNVYRTRPIEKVTKEIEEIPQKYLWFCDPSLTIDLNYIKNLFRELKNYNKKLLKCNGNVNVLANDDELLRVSSEAGCMEWLIGFESLSQKSLEISGKGTNKIEDYKKAVKKIHDHGMEIRGEFIFGFDYDTSDIFEKTYDAIIKMEIDNPTFNILTPYPGTSLYNRLEKEGRILTKDWSKYNLWNVVFKPKLMTESELAQGTYKAQEKLYSTYNTLRRIVKSSELGIYPFKSTLSKNFRFWLNRFHW